jgi:hypothetical protein
MIAVANQQIPVVPDIGTEKAARLATELTGNPGCWVRLDCGHHRHVQQPVQAGVLLDCPTCPPSVGGGLVCRRVLPPASERRLSARLAADALAASKARELAAQAVTAAGLNTLVHDVEQLVGELVATAVNHSEAPVELTIDAHDEVVRVEVRDEARGDALEPAVYGSGKVVWAELRGGDVA